MSSTLNAYGGRTVTVDFDGYDRIRASSSQEVNDRIEEQVTESVYRHSKMGEEEIGRRLEKLEREWDVDRAIMALFPLLAGITTVLGLTRSRKYFGLLAIQLSFLEYHATQGWCPPMYVLRKLGFRSRQEIDSEKYALKTLRGDFAHRAA